MKIRYFSLFRSISLCVFVTSFASQFCVFDVSLHFIQPFDGDAMRWVECAHLIVSHAKSIAHILASFTVAGINQFDFSSFTFLIQFLFVSWSCCVGNVHFSTVLDHLLQHNKTSSTKSIFKHRNPNATLIGSSIAIRYCSECLSTVAWVARKKDGVSSQWF